MQAQAGSLMLIKVKIDDVYQIIGGLRTTRMVINNDLIDISSKSSGKWRTLLNGAGISSISISGGGLFTNSASEQLIREYAYNNEVAEYLLTFGNGEKVLGKFMINHYERSGNHQEEENYNLTLESTGKITWNY